MATNVLNSVSVTAVFMLLVLNGFVWLFDV